MAAKPRGSVPHSPLLLHALEDMTTINEFCFPVRDLSDDFVKLTLFDVCLPFMQPHIRIGWIIDLVM